MVSGVVIAVNLGSIGAIYSHGLVIITEGNFPKQAPLAVILT